MSAIIDSILESIEDNYCCCRGAIGEDPQCQMHDIVGYFRESYKRKMTEYHDVDEYYKD